MRPPPGGYPVLSLFQQFHGAEVPAPNSTCGEDPTEDSLTCLAFALCPLDCFDQQDLEILVAQNFETEDCLMAPALEVLVRSRLGDHPSDRTAE